MMALGRSAKMSSLFIVTSATNTKFGVFSSGERVQQTLRTFHSVRDKVPNAKILLVEMGGDPLTSEQNEIYQAQSDYLIDFSNSRQVRSVYDQTNNWDIVKNVTEVMMFGEVLQIVLKNRFANEFGRMFKISGRYQLTNHFNIEYHLAETESIVVSRYRDSQFSAQVTGGLSKQYMSRLWSWPSKLSLDILDVYRIGLDAMTRRINEGGYFDIEHMLYKYLPPNLVTEVAQIGVRGHLGPNGELVED